MEPFAQFKISLSMQPELEVEQGKQTSVTKNSLHFLSSLEDRAESNLKIYMRQNNLRIELRIPLLENQSKEKWQKKQGSYDEYFKELESLDDENKQLKIWFDSLEDMCQYMTQNSNENIKVDLQNKKIKILIKNESALKKQVQIHEIKLRKNIGNASIGQQLEDQNPNNIKYSDINSVLKKMSSKLIDLWDVHQNYNNNHGRENKDGQGSNNYKVVRQVNRDTSQQKNSLIRQQIHVKLQMLQVKILELKQRQDEKLKNIEDHLNVMCSKIEDKANLLEERLLGKQRGRQNANRSINKIENEVIAIDSDVETDMKKGKVKINEDTSEDKNSVKINKINSIKKQETRKTSEIMHPTKQEEMPKRRQRDKKSKHKKSKNKIKMQEQSVQKQSDKNKTKSEQIAYLQTNKQSRNYNSYKQQQMLTQNSFQQQLKQQTERINSGVKIKQFRNTTRKEDARTFYRIKGILQNKKQQSQGIPSFIDENSAYACCYKFDRNKVTLENILEGTESRMVMLMGSTRVRQKSVFTFNILRTNPHISMGVGITDRKNINKRNLKAGENVARINSKGFILDGNKSEKVGDFIFGGGDTITMKIYIEYCIVEWTINKTSYSCICSNLKNNSIEWVAFVEMRRIGDSLQWIQ